MMHALCQQTQKKLTLVFVTVSNTDINNTAINLNFKKNNNQTNNQGNTSCHVI